MARKSFDDWFLTFGTPIDDYEYYTDFSKACKNIDKLKLEIYMLNSLEGSKNIEDEFDNLVREFPKCLKVIPILLTFHKNAIDKPDAFNYDFFENNLSIEQYKNFMRKIGFFDMLQKRKIGVLYDYLTSIKIFLSPNNEKILDDHKIKSMTKHFLREANVSYYGDMRFGDIEEKWNVDLSAISGGRTSTKRFDFVVKTAENIFAIETNFYTDGGSKLNETARSYKLIAEESKKISGFKFVWITDGRGWLKAKGNLKETFLVLENLYNIKDLEDGIFWELFK